MEKKLKFEQFGTLLTREEAKKIRGGGQVCLASKLPTGGLHQCSSSQDFVEDFAGDTGWWCCNCEEALVACT